MQPLIRARLDTLTALCRKHAVRRLDLFGSALRADFDEKTSDVDLVVEFDVTTPGRRIEQYFDLKSDLESLFARPVDLVELGALESPRLRRLIERSRVSLYAASA